MNLDSLSEKIEELPLFENPTDWMQYGRIPYKIRCDLEQPAGILVNKRSPAAHRVTPDLTPGDQLIVNHYLFGFGEEFQKTLEKFCSIMS